MENIKTNSRSLFSNKYFPLVLIILLAFVLRLYDLNYNSPFLDEAQYLVLGKKVLAGHWQESEPFAWVGGMPLFYPAVSAIFGVFGIIGSRFLSVLLGTASVYLLYLFSKDLRFFEDQKINHLVGLVSAAFIAVLAMPLFLSRLAIYDMLSFTLFLAGLVFVQKAVSDHTNASRQKENTYLFAAFMFFLSFLAKYITLILFPVVLLWALAKTKKENLRQLFGYFVGPLLVATAIYIIWNLGDLIHFQTEQVSSAQNMSRAVLNGFFQYTLPVILLGPLGVVFLVLRGKIFKSLLLVFAALIVPAVHVITNNSASSNQHTYLSLMFLIPLAAYLFALAFEKQRYLGAFLSLVFLIPTLIISLQQLRSLEASWTNTSEATKFLRANTSSHERVLSSEDDVTILGLPNIKEENIAGIYNFEYDETSGNDAYSQALQNGHFDYILIDEDKTDETSNIIKNSLTSRYSPVYSSHPFLIYKKGS